MMNEQCSKITKIKLCLKKHYHKVYSLNLGKAEVELISFRTMNTNPLSDEIDNDSYFSY